MINELLEKLKKSKTDEERKRIIEENKSLLTDAELDQISGGRHYTHMTFRECKS